MRFMIMHKNDPKNEAGEKPPMEIVHAMGALIGECKKTGRYVDGAGLRGSAKRTRLVFRDGRVTTRRGPYRGEHELPAAALKLEVRSREQAIGWAERYGKILVNCEIELGEVKEPWEIGPMPEPEDPPLHFLIIEKADAGTEAGTRSPQQKAALTRLKTEMTKAGVLLGSVRLKPSAEGKRLAFRNDDMMVMDGPFAESKELLGGFAVMELSGMEEAIALCRRYAKCLGGTVELDLRFVDPED